MPRKPEEYVPVNVLKNPDIQVVGDNKIRYYLRRPVQTNIEQAGRGERAAPVCFILSNPDLHADGRAVEKCRSYTKLWSAGPMFMLSLLPWRGPSKDIVGRYRDGGLADGREFEINQNWLHAVIGHVHGLGGIVVAAWGRETLRPHCHRTCKRPARAGLAERLVLDCELAHIPLYAIRLGKTGSPVHPCFEPFTDRPVPWNR